MAFPSRNFSPIVNTETVKEEKRNCACCCPALSFKLPYVLMYSVNGYNYKVTPNFQEKKFGFEILSLLNRTNQGVMR